MIKLLFFMLAFILSLFTLYAQPVSPFYSDPCIPCTEHVFDITSYAPGGWSLTLLTKSVSYGGCIFTVKYKTRECSPYQDVRIDGITMDPGCTNKLLSSKGNMSDCEWLKAVQDMSVAIMSEFLRANMSGAATWRVSTPSCFALSGNSFLSERGFETSYGCDNACCVHVIEVYTDDCGIVRRREVAAGSNGGCPSPPPQISYKSEGGMLPTSGFESDIANHIYYPKSAEYEIVVQKYKPSLLAPCTFVYKKGETNCIPICGRSLTEFDFGTK